MQGLGLAQDHIGFHKLPDSWAEGAEVSLQDSDPALILGLDLRRHGEGFWRDGGSTDRKRKSKRPGKETWEEESDREEKKLEILAQNYFFKKKRRSKTSVCAYILTKLHLCTQKGIKTIES